MTPVASKKLMRRRQVSPAIDKTVAFLPRVQEGENPMLELLMDLSSRMSASEEYFDKCRKN